MKACGKQSQGYVDGEEYGFKNKAPVVLSLLTTNSHYLRLVTVFYANSNPFYKLKHREFYMTKHSWLKIINPYNSSLQCQTLDIDFRQATN